MKSMPLRLAALAVATAVGTGCSGGGGSDRGTGTLTLSLMDAPVDNVTEVNVEITAIWLKSADDEDGPAFELPLVDGPIKVDLLELTEENAAILVDGAVIDAGAYEWLAMDVNAEFDNVYDSYVMTDTGGMEELRVPSGRVRLVSGFEVEANQAVRLLFDWDMRTGLVNPPGLPGHLLRPAFRVLDAAEYGLLRGTVAMSTVTAAEHDCNADSEADDYDIGNAIYIFEGLDAEPDDIDGNDPEPVATVDAKRNDAGDYEYRALLAPGDYTVALTCHAANDEAETDETGNPDPADDTVLFVAAANVTIAADGEAVEDF